MVKKSIAESLAELDEIENSMAMVEENPDDFIVLSDEELAERGLSTPRPINTMIDIQFKDSEDDLKEMQAIYNRLGFDALFMTHYQLAAGNRFTPMQWKMFITDPRINAFINEELELLKQQKVAAMLRESDSNRNVGQAQLLNTLLNQTKRSDKKEGPVFVYCWVPLNENEQHATNVEVQDVSLTEYFKNQERPDTV